MRGTLRESKREREREEGEERETGRGRGDRERIEKNEQCYFNQSRAVSGNMS